VNEVPAENTRATDNLVVLHRSLREALRDLFLAHPAAAGRTVAVHLVGASFELAFPPEQFPDVHVNRDAVDAADASARKPGDFVIGDTVFHVTVAPSKGHFVKCEQNVQSNLRPVLLVPESQLASVVGALRLQYSARIEAFSIESFVAQNIEELSMFSYPVVRERVKQLVEIYNQRVDEAERGKPYLRIDATRV
jgi:hypothetical protein